MGWDLAIGCGHDHLAELLQCRGVLRRVIRSKAVEGIARRQHRYVPRQALRYLDLYARREFERDHHRVDHSVKLGAIVEKTQFSGEWIIFGDSFAHIAGDDHFDRQVIERNIAGKYREKASKVHDMDGVVRSQEPQGKWCVVM